MRVKTALAEEILTLKEVAQCLKLAENTAYRLAKVGGSWWFKLQDIEHWIAEQKLSAKQRKASHTKAAQKNNKASRK